MGVRPPLRVVASIGGLRLVPNPPYIFWFFDGVFVPFVGLGFEVFLNRDEGVAPTGLKVVASMQR